MGWWEPCDRRGIPGYVEGSRLEPVHGKLGSGIRSFDKNGTTTTTLIWRKDYYQSNLKENYVRVRCDRLPGPTFRLQPHREHNNIDRPHLLLRPPADLRQVPEGRQQPGSG